MDDQQRLRYSRHLLLDEFGEEAQERLLASRALVIGAGGLGSSALMFLAASGVGHITVADGDKVEITNLQRQIAHRVASIGENKAASAARTHAALNPDLELAVLPSRLAAEAIAAQVARADIVLDCSDNFATRYAVNRACVQARKPLVSGAGIRFDGQVSVFDLRREDAACYHCLFAEDAEAEDVRCAVMGVFAPVVGIIGTMQAMEAIKLLAGVGEPLAGRLLLCDALAGRFHEVRFTRDPHCKVCAPFHANTALPEAAHAS
jgi:molybdopterin/thiamine biosynthesis adenylyltransferase